MLEQYAAFVIIMFVYMSRWRLGCHVKLALVSVTSGGGREKFAT